MTYTKFVGRSSELSQIKNWLQRSTGGLVLITGAGGIGKTSLLQKIVEECSVGDQFVVEYFDLAEQSAHIISQAVHLTNSLGRENFPDFYKKLEELNVGSGELASFEMVNAAVDTCVQEIGAYLKKQNKRLLRITDTFEIVLKYGNYRDDQVNVIDNKLLDIPGVVFIVAGRDRMDGVNVFNDLYPILTNSFDEKDMLFIPLSGFDKVEMEEFFNEYDEHYIIPNDMREKLDLLTGGRPVLLSLAIEWLQKNIPLPQMIEKSSLELKALVESDHTKDDLLNNFEFELISRVRQLSTSSDIAILYMAHIDRRMDIKLLSVLLDVDETEAGKILNGLLELSFVKEFIGSNPPKCTLHDEMRVMVTKYAWDYLDISGGERRRLTQKVVEQYYRHQIDLLKQQKDELLRPGSKLTLLQDVQARENDWDRWILEAESLYYYTKLGPNEGFSYFDRVFYDKGGTYIRGQLLLDELKKAGLNRDKIFLREADDLRRRGQVEKARTLCSDVLAKDSLDVADRIHGYITLGYIDSESDPILAERNFQRALDLAKPREDPHVLAILYNNLGQLYRNTSRLEESISHFQQAIHFAQTSGNQTARASIRNNLAWTYRLNGDLDEADALCSLAIAENRKQGQERPLAYAYLTKADIYRDRGDLQDAERYAKQALDMFGRLEDRDGKAQAYRTLSNIYRYLHNFEQALSFLREGILLVEDSNSYRLLASLYQLYGRTFRHYASYIQDTLEDDDGRHKDERSRLLSEALNTLQKSIKLAEKAGNRWDVARSQLEIVLINLLSHVSFNQAELSELLDQVWKTADELDDELLKGYVYENRATIEMRNMQYLEAGRALGNAAYHIASRTGQESTRGFSRLHNILLDSNLKADQSDALARGVYEQVRQEVYQNNPKLVALVTMCEQLLDLPTDQGD